MNRQAIALVYSLTGACHIVHRHHGPELPCAVSDKNLSHQDLFCAGQKVDSRVLAADKYISHIDLNLALTVSHFQLRKTYILSFYSAFISIYVRNQSAIISHITTPLPLFLYDYCKIRPFD